LRVLIRESAELPVSTVNIAAVELLVSRSDRILGVCLNVKQQDQNKGYGIPDHSNPF
jgi:hypothetical protein